MTPEELTMRAHSLTDLVATNARRTDCWKATLTVFARDSKTLEKYCYMLREADTDTLQSGEEWLADHADFLAEQAVELRSAISRSFRDSLRIATRDGVPRVLALCDDYFTTTDNAWSEESFVAYINAYQDIDYLSLAEVWGLSITVRLVLISRLILLTQNLAARREELGQTKRLMRQIVDAARSANDGKGDSANPLELTNSVVATLAHRIRRGDDDADLIRHWVRTHVEGGLDRVDKVMRASYHERALYQIRIGNAITNLIQLSRLDWIDIFVATSVVERRLQEDSSGTYLKLDMVSQDNLRHRVEALSRRWNLPESVVTEGILTLVQRAVDSAPPTAEFPDTRHRFVGYYLLSVPGIRRLRAELSGVSAGSKELGPQDSARTDVGRRYFISLALLMMAFFALIGWSMTVGFQLHWGGYLLVALFSLLPASEWSIAAVHAIVRTLRNPVPLMRFNFEPGVAADACTMVVVPTILWSEQGARQSVRQLELHHACTRDANVHYALLADLCDSQTETLPEDSLLISTTTAAIDALNRRYREAGSTFHLLLRHRRYNESERRWMGWERKRGKLVEFVALLHRAADPVGNSDAAGGGQTGAIDAANAAVTFSDFAVNIGDASIYAKIRYLITLDDDTRLTPGSAQRMIATMHLPYNRPRLNASGTRVIGGYGALQPRVGIEHAAAFASRLARYWSGNPGIDPYAITVSDPYQDTFGHGIFMGKGILHVEAFHRLLARRIPNDSVLSHDLLEGGFLRTGFLSDVEVVDSFPSTFFNYQQRIHRWLRGDWQLLPWLRRRMLNRDGVREPADLPHVTRWQILDNLRRSLLQPALFITLACAMTVLPGNPLRWWLLVLLTLWIPLERQLATVAVRSLFAWEFRRIVLQGVFSVLLLPAQVLQVFDAVGRTLYRMLISKRRLLEWQSSAQTERLSDSYNRHAWRRPYATYLLILLFALIVSIWGHDWRIPGLALVVLWCLTPMWITWLNHSPRLSDVGPRLDQAEELRKIAADTWGFYRDYVTAKENHLPPDNIQLDPPVGEAFRTSPTNIAMYLLSLVAAADLGFIDVDEYQRRLGATLSTLERMEKWNGHLYNWYEIRTLRLLPPAYVSSVDSGNFVAGLVAVRQAILEHVGPPGQETTLGALAESTNHWVALAERVERLIVGTDFRPLYDHATNLFTLGYHVDDDSRDTIQYDLLASEARQTSFVAIALGQVPAEHWFRLNRTMTLVSRVPTLLSWTGTMFEYFMPALLMRTYEDSIWETTYRGVVDQQMRYATLQGIPFGVSESGYYDFDAQKNYQYRAFGVPELALKRGLEQDLVVAPYATMLCMRLIPEHALTNFHRLQGLGAYGKYGFFEAIDFTAERVPTDKGYAVIQNYMAHHQGMVLLALANMLNKDKMQARFHHDVRVEAAQTLLQERVARRTHLVPHPAAVAVHRGLRYQQPRALVTREFPSVRAALSLPKEVLVLSNGRLTSVVDSMGGGFLKYDNAFITRWRDDPLGHSYGHFLYIRDADSGDVWSPTFAPTGWDSVTADSPTDGCVVFSTFKAQYQVTRGDLAAEFEVSVSPESNVEIRRLNLFNRGHQTRQVELTTFMELSLAELAADLAHPAFTKLFVETTFDAEGECLIAHRRVRQTDETPLFVAHRMSLLRPRVPVRVQSESGFARLFVPGAPVRGDGEVPRAVMARQKAQGEPLKYESNRASFIGRGNNLHTPNALLRPLNGDEGAVVDPAFSLRRSLSLEPGESLTVYISTAAGESAAEVAALTTRASGVIFAQRSLYYAEQHSQIELQQLSLTQSLVASAHLLASRALYRSTRCDAGKAAVLANTMGQSGLWSIGISGDHPVVLLEVEDITQIDFVVTTAHCHDYLRRRGVCLDLVLLLNHPGGYLQPLRDAIVSALEKSVHHELSPATGVFFLGVQSLSESACTLLRSFASVLLQAGGESLSAQLQRLADPLPLPDPLRPRDARTHETRPMSAKQDSTQAAQDVQASSVPWHFGEDGREFHIRWHQDSVTTGDRERFAKAKDGHSINPTLPWSNVMANERFGTLVTELGSGYTWFRNSREYKLTPWHNDPVLDPQSELLLLRNESNGEFWSAFPSPRPGAAEYGIRHGFGYTVYTHERDGLAIETTIFVAAELPAKLTRVTIHNQSDAIVTLSATAYAEWVLGVSPEFNRAFIVSKWDQEHASLLANNRYQESFRGCVGAIGVVGGGRGADGSPGAGVTYTADRAQFLGALGDYSAPAAMTTANLSGSTGVVADACGAVRTEMTIAAGETRTVSFVIAAGDSDAEIVEVLRQFAQPRSVDAELERVNEKWGALTGQLRVQTPDSGLNALVGGWLLYQVLSSRMWGRTAFYQAGGAYGFRDQLQDSLALLHTAPDLTRRQILLHACHQYEEGDVSHWWHEETKKGIRTRYSDDLLWLPYATARYVEHTGDYGILAEMVPFLSDAPLAQGELERYGDSVVGTEQAPLYQHCVRAIDFAVRQGTADLKLGEHGLPLMGTGDWNDGMNSVGAKGRGESVWLGWFLCTVLDGMGKLAAATGHDEDAAGFIELRAQIGEALDTTAWDGAWYRRAFTDEGVWLGSGESTECRIDAIAQSWAVISGSGHPIKCRSAMASLERELVDEDLNLVRLLWPPFGSASEGTGTDPGYIKGYPPGIRENGGQYTHGIVWAVIALAMQGEADRAYRLLGRLLPTTHTMNDPRAARYQGEPYAVAADIYACGPLAGRAGWTWYTGAAGWLYQAVVEWVLGIRRKADELTIQPMLPSDWPGFDAVYRCQSAAYILHIQRAGDHPRGLTVDGGEVEPKPEGEAIWLPLRDDGQTHEVWIRY